jgi:predicted O-methyltransferase YrrM
VSLFSDPSSFDPNRDSKMPVRRGPVWLVVRALNVLGNLMLSRHPMDAWVWLQSMYARRRPLSMEIPWLTFDAIRYIASELPDGAKVFEFGSGHSTLYWLRRGATVNSVEDEASWHEMLSSTLAERALSNCHLVHAETLSTYLSAIETCSPASQDLVLVDGAHRRDCVIAAIPYVKPGGMLVVDNTDWHWFRDAPIQGIPADWQRHPFPGFCPMLGHRSETTVWKRPSS